MAKKYMGSLSLEWFNKQKSILVQSQVVGTANGDVPAPTMNWINKDEALYFEIVDQEGRGLAPYWVDRNDLRVREARPLIFQKAYTALEKTQPNNLIDKELKLLTSDNDDAAIENMLIRGDNLLALNSLKKLFANRPDDAKVKCIYIDPPYNTGSAFRQYDDSLAHSEWLTLLRDRLLVLWSLLSKDGSIWISVDDEESHYLKALCDELFGRQNFVANVIWQKKYAKQNDATWFSTSHDHIIVYAKNKETWRPAQLTRGQEQLKGYSNPDNDPRGVWQSVVYTCNKTADERPNLYYPISHPKTGAQIYPDRTRVWGCDLERTKRNIAENRLWWGINQEKEKPRLKVFLSEVGTGVVPDTLWLRAEVGDNQDAKREVKEINAKDIFATPKPERLIQRVLHLATNEGDLVLDCFGGSGTTFAVAQKMNRRWIGIEVGQHADTHIIPRLKKVLCGKDNSGISKATNWTGGGSFKYYILGDSIIDPPTREFNWKLGCDFIEQSLLSSYDFAPDLDFSFPQAELVTNATESPSIGFHRIGQKQMAGVVSLVEPRTARPITYDEFMLWYNAIKNFKGTQSITVFTNRGVELAYDSKPDDVEIIKVPHAIFAELEK